MINRRLGVTLLAFTLLFDGPPAALVVAGTAPQAPGQQSASTPEQDIERRRHNEKGISVDDPKVYDDSLLQQMLQAAEAKLGAMQVLDQAGVASRIGALSGATQRVSAVGVNLQTPSVPGVTTTDKGETGTTVTTTTRAENAGVKSSSDVTAQTTGAAAQDVVTTAPAFAPPAMLTPAASTTLPTTIGISASDALNEQMQLTYEIANLRLLLEGALSDHVMVVEGKPYVKPRTTLGFPITIDADKRFKGAVAIVEVEIDPAGGFQSQNTTITALLPREKTYNVAAITDSTTSIGAGVATSVVGISGSWLRGHKTYFVTQDQDTVASTFTPSDRRGVGFRWQFRPVLGKASVRSGLKQTFVQLAFPHPLDADVFGTARIRTYWVKYDEKKGTLGEIVKDSLREQRLSTITRGTLATNPIEFNNASLQDLGGGQMMVTVQGRFLTGTYIRIGSTILREGAPNTLFEHFGIKFTASIADLANKDVAIVARDGREQRLTTSAMRVTDDGRVIEAILPKTVEPAVTGLDDGNVLLTVDVDEVVARVAPPPLLIVGGRVFGYSDAPVERQGMRMTAVMPASLVLANPNVTVTHLFAAKPVPPAKIDGLGRLSRSERLVLLEQGKDSSRFLLYGNRLGSLKVIEPMNITVGDVGQGEEKDSLRLLTLTTAQLKSHKQLVLQRGSERPFLLAMPGTLKPPAVKAKERVVVAADAALFEADSSEGLTKVFWKEQELSFDRLADGKTIRVHGLKALGITTALTTQTIDFTFDSGKTSASIEIVNSRVESIGR